MRDRWPNVRLGEVLTLSPEPHNVVADAEYPNVGMYSYARGLFLKRPIVGSATSAKVLFRVKKDQFIYSRLFAFEGAYGVVPAEFDGAFVSNEYPTFDVDRSRLLPQFLELYFKQPTVWEAVAKASTGVGHRRQRVPPSGVLSTTIPLPPLSDQHRVVSRITAITGKVEEAKRLRGEAEVTADNLCRSILSHAATVTHVAMESLVTLRPNDIRVQPNQVYQFAGVYSFGRGVFRSVRKSGSEFSYERLTALRAGDFVYPKLMAWEGALGVVPPECDGCAVSPEFPTFEVDHSQVLPEVLDVHFRTPSVWPDIAALSTGTNVRRRRVHPSAFMTYMFPLPDMATQQRMVRARHALNRASGVGTSLTTELDAMLPAVLNKTFRGEM